MSTRVDVCVVEDDKAHRALITRTLRQSGQRVADAETVEAGFQLVKSEQPKVILCDYRLPDATGLDLLRQVRQDPLVADTHFILTTAQDNPHLKSKAWDGGVDDYLAKPLDPLELQARIRVGTRIWQMQEHLRAAVITDGLTGLYNHDHLNRVLDREMNRSRRYGRPLSMVMMDLDFFKAVNDTYGHPAGNQVLEEVARVLRESARTIDTPARFGGEEFAIVMPETTAAHACAAADRIRLAIADSLCVEAVREHVVTASFGVADTNDSRVRSAADLMDLADRALYLAKHQGRNRVVKADQVPKDTDTMNWGDVGELEVLRKRVAVLNTQAKEAHIQSIAALGQALEEKDPFTARHSQNVSFYCEQIARHLGCAEATTKAVRNAALLHDIGKIGIPDHILRKRQALTSLERMVMSQVPLISTRVVDRLRILESEVQIIRHQREFYDGSGYPSGLAGEQIPVGSRILFVADAFDAMTTDRVYRERIDIEGALRELNAYAGTQFDPRAVLAVEQILHDRRTNWLERIDETIEMFQSVIV